MLTSLSLWILAVSLGQSPAPAPADAGWLKAVPADVDVAVRVRGVDATRAGPDGDAQGHESRLAERAEQGLAGPLAQFRQHVRRSRGQEPRGSASPGASRRVVEGQPPFAFLVLE